MTDNEIIACIRDGDQLILSNTYNLYRKEFIRWMRKVYRCSEDDAQEIYQIAFFTFYDQVMTGKLTYIMHTLKTYLFGIGKNKYYQYQRTENRQQELPPEVDDIEETTEEECYARETRCQRIEEALIQLGQPCEDILRMKYYENRSMEYIMVKLGYKNAATAKNLKFKCKERLKKILMQITIQ